jgi:hypothetical protein
VPQLTRTYVQLHRVERIGNMRSGLTTQKPLLRSLAAMTLAVFVVAEAMCFVHCHFGGGHGDAEKPSCHQAASARADHDQDAPTAPSSSKTSCATLQNLLASNGVLTLLVPEFPPLYTLGPLVLSLDATIADPTASISRSTRHRDWVLTPEVCLGPALHSLAPPLLS